MTATNAKAKTFRTKITAKVLAICAMPVGCGLLLFYFGLDAANKFSPNDPARIPFAGLPMLLGLLLLSAVVLTLHHFLNREVIVEDEYLVYKDSKTELHLEIAKMAYSPPNERGFLKMLMFSDGETFVQLPQIFLGDRPFVELNELISSKRRKARTQRNAYTL